MALRTRLACEHPLSRCRGTSRGWLVVHVIARHRSYRDPPSPDAAKLSRCSTSARPFVRRLTMLTSMRCARVILLLFCVGPAPQSWRPAGVYPLRPYIMGLRWAYVVCQPALRVTGYACVSKDDATSAVRLRQWHRHGPASSSSRPHCRSDRTGVQAR